MKINRVEIDNFMAIGSATVAYDDKGLVLIQGENKDDTSQNSNGAGKSTLVEALGWALYNETARGDSGDRVINRAAKKDCRVLVQVVDDDKTYNIIRHRKHTTHKNRLMLLDVTDPLDVLDFTSATDKATQERITKIIGCSSDVFRAAIYYGQESQVDLPSLTDKNLKAIVEEAAGIDKMQAAHVIANSKLSEAKKDFERAKLLINNIESQIEISKASVDELKVKKDEFVKSNAESIKRLTGEAKACIVKAKEINSALSSIDREGLISEKDEISSKLAGIKKENDHLIALSTKVTNLEADLSTAQRSFGKEKSGAESAKAKLLKINDEIGKACKSCGHVIEASDLKSRIAAVKTEAKEKISEAKSISEAIEALKLSISAARAEVESYKSKMTDTSASVKRRKLIDDELAKYDAEKLKGATVTEKVKNLKKSIAETKEAKNPYDDLIDSANEKSKELGEKLKASKVALAAIEKQVEIKSNVVEVFSPSGIRAHILDTVTPFLNERTAQYLGVLSDGNISAQWSTLSKTSKGELREKFVIDVGSETGGDTYKSLSGGEKRKVRLSTALALQDLVSSRAAKPIELWIGDEIDDAVDESGLERLMTVLEEKAKEKGTVLIISHNELSDWCRQHASICKEGGKASVAGVLNIKRDIGV